MGIKLYRHNIESLKATGVAVPQNIKFYTYTRLMKMSKEEIAEI